MKRVAGWLAAYLLYGVGHALSKPMLWWDWAFLYGPYNALMIASSDVQRWGGAGPWSPGEGP